MTRPAKSKSPTRAGADTTKGAKAPSKARPTRSPTRSQKGETNPPATTTAAEIATTFVASRQRNAKALIEAGRSSYSGIAAVLKRRLVILRETLAELRAVAAVMREAGVRESVTHLDDLARGAVQLTLNSVRELAGLAASTQKEALDILARRLQEDLAEFKRLRSGRHTPPAK